MPDDRGFARIDGDLKALFCWAQLQVSNDWFWFGSISLSRAKSEVEMDAPSLVRVLHSKHLKEC